MNLAELAFYELFGGRKSERSLRVRYSAAFKSYNANVKYTRDWMEFKLSSEWEPISDEIKIGLIQSLMVKVFREKVKKTINMDLYENFIKGIGEYRPATKIDPFLQESFNRVNEKYFSNWLEPANLVWGGHSFTKLGTYTYADNTITISKALADSQELLDYVMYHEMLHKKHKYKTSDGGRSHHHTAEFRREEARFDLPDAEEELTRYLRRKKWAFGSEEREARRESGRQDRKRRLWEWFFG